MTLNSFNHFLHKIMQYTLVCFMVVMITAVVWQVFTRFVLQDPSNFTDELSRYLLMWIGLLGGAYTFAIKRHLALDLLSPQFGHKGKCILHILINIVILMFSIIVLIYGGILLVSNTLANGQISPGIVFFGNHLLIGYVYLVVPIAGIIISYFGIIELLTSFIALLTSNNATATKEA